jgi:formate C-acetyltransferase
MDDCILSLKNRLEKMSDDMVFLERMTLLEEANKKYKYDTAAVKYAKSFSMMLKKMSIVLDPSDRLVGRIREELLDAKENEAYNEKCRATNFQAVRLFSLEPLGLSIISDSELMYAPEWFNSWGHCRPDYERLMKLGFVGIYQEALDMQRIAAEDVEKTEFITCCVLCLEALLDYVRRCKEAIREAERGSLTPLQKHNYARMLQGLINIEKGAPTSFYEALQIVWFTNMLLHTVCGARDYALGRMDKYLWSFYKRDIDEKRITKEEAFYLIEDFVIKCNEIIGRSWEGYKQKRVLSVNSIQYVMLGGIDIQGNDVTNELSFLFLDAVEELKLKQPTLNIRWHEGINEKFFRRGCQIASEGLGYPSFFNDKTVIPALEYNGIAHEDSVDYAHYGCNNSILMGKEDELREAWHNVPLYLELALNEGRRFGHEELLGEKTTPISQMESFEDVIEALGKQIRYGIVRAKAAIEYGDRKWQEIKPFAFESVFMTESIKRMSSFNADGSKYKHMTNHFVGFATTTNSLYSINRLVFNEKRLTLPQLVAHLEADWNDAPQLQAEIVNNFSKYGNDQDDVDSIGVNIAGLFIEELKKAGTTSGGRRLYPSIYSLWHQRALGEIVSATADGRNSGEQLSESQSPTYNTDVNGPTALFNSISKLPLDKTPTGGVNVKFQPSLFKNQGGEWILQSLIAAYFKKGGMHMQINVVDRKVLEDAKRQPEKHKNLLVRVVGYSAYFVTLSPEQQDEIINRTALG